MPDPQHWVDQVKDAPVQIWPDQATIDRDQDNPGPFTAQNFFTRATTSPVPITMPDSVKTRSDFKKLIDGYDAGIRYMDDRIGEVLNTLEEAGVLEETAIIVSADHGEQFGELGVYGDHCAAAAAVQNVPLIISWPGVTPPNASCRDLVLNVDLAPTLCDLLGIPIPSGWDGTSLVRQLRGDAAPEWRQHVVYTHGLYCCQRAVRTHQWQLTRTYHPGTFLHDQVMLHDLQNDRYQTTNVAAEHPEVVAEMDHLLTQWLNDELGRPGAGPDPLQFVVETGPWKYVQLDSWLDRLEQWGRPQMAEAIRHRLDLPVPAR